MNSNVASPDTIWFSEFFGVESPQYELPFVDFSLTSDVPLYLDPYAITKDTSDLAANCHNSIVSYFQTLLDAVSAGDNNSIRRLISGRLSEPVEIHLGVGKTARRGRGIGKEQEEQVVSALANSSALQTGAIQAIQELELHIPGIGPDKISDLIANIILSHLAEFTQAICRDYAISSRPCAVSGFWNYTRLEWDGGYFDLPTHNGDAYILVPKKFVRRERDLMNHRDFYRKYMLEILQREMLDANDSLVQTLKTGERRVTKKSLQDDPRFAMSKAVISEFILHHPEVINAYRNEMGDSFDPLDAAQWSGKAAVDDPEIEELLSSLTALATGRENASDYHVTVFRLLEFVFDWALENFESEQHMDGGRGRIDIIADNYASGGLFAEIRRDLNAHSTPIECKNYSSDLGNSEFNQLADRLGSTTSRFGMLFCRSINDHDVQLKHCADRWLRHQIVMLQFDDDALIELVRLRLARDYHGIEATLRKMIRNVKFAGTGSAI